MKRRIMSLILVASIFLTLAACGHPDAEPNSKESSSTHTPTTDSATSLPQEVSPIFQKFVGEWRTLDNDTVTTIVVNPNMTISYNGKTIGLTQVSPTQYAMDTPMEVAFFGDMLSSDLLDFWLMENGLYALSIGFQRDASIGYSECYFRVEDYQIVELNGENYQDYVDISFDSDCERDPFKEYYTNTGSFDLYLACDYIYDLEITYTGTTTFRPVTFNKGTLPDIGEITSSAAITETIKTEHPFSSSPSYAHQRYIMLYEDEFSTWPENYTAEDVRFIEVDEIIAVSGKALIAQKLPADDPNHVHFYDSDTCFDDNGNSWQECECGEKSHVTKSDPQ